ncbi:hypothetical protein E4L96_07850 [Massilia arenosa]|uniref:Band 7 domain-containing protein n=1 Tax=Zemynaea arenosa TaxID=2561931 RepID=A0A4Y9SJB1_9BURK|nr:hypothetical protein [Massilia arenosa]TFW22435.1 hypothetical protein E4L96_07850 [Massilia arenosa]
MFQAFGFGGVPCARCGHKQASDSAYCERCGMAAGTPRNEPVLRDNRWIAAPNEFAVFFGVRELSGLFVKTLRVPATTRAYILQGGQATEVPQGEYEIEGFFTRLNNLLRDRHAEILITRTAALPVRFGFEGLRTAEGLEVALDVSISIKIENVAAFAQHFMTVPGTITEAHLQELLAPSVRQLAAEFTGSQALREMSRNRDLRAQLDERLHSALRLRLAQFGLAAVDVDTLTLRHDKLNANRERAGSLWLIAEGRQADLEHTKALDQLYNDEEWQRIWREEQEARLRFRHAEMKQDQDVENRELVLQRTDRMQAIRLREIELYGRVAESQNRIEALRLDAAEVLAQLEHEATQKKSARAGEAAEWAHVRDLARVKMRAALEAAQQDAQHERQFAQQRFMHQLVQQQIRNKIEQALAIEDEAHKRGQLALLHQAERDAKLRLQALEAEHHRAALQSLAIDFAARERAAQRDESLKDAIGHEDVEQVNQRIAALRRSGASADAIAQQEKLLRTIEADAAYERKRMELRIEEGDATWQREVQRMETLAQVDDTAKLVLAPAANAELLADVMKTRVHATMNAGQLQGLAGVEAARTPKTNTDSPAPRICANGHAAGPQDRYCPQCGVELTQ